MVSRAAAAAWARQLGRWPSYDPVFYARAIAAIMISLARSMVPRGALAVVRMEAEMSDSILEEWQKELKVLLGLMEAQPSKDWASERDRVAVLNKLIAEHGKHRRSL